MPQNMVLIAKLNDISAKEGGEYKVLCNENDYLATRKVNISPKKSHFYMVFPLVSLYIIRLPKRRTVLSVLL